MPLRKPGKLPSKSIGVDFKQSAGKGAAYFGKDRLEMHEDGLKPGSRVLIIDDMLGTGSTMYGACELVRFVYLYVYIYVCMYIYICIRACVRICLYVHKFLSICSTYTYIHMYIYVIHTLICMYVFAHLHIFGWVFSHLVGEVCVRVWGSGVGEGGQGVGGSFEREGASVNVCVGDVFMRSTCVSCVCA